MASEKEIRNLSGGEFEKLVERCGMVAHTINLHYCAALGDHSQTVWEEAPEWQQASARSGVEGVLNGNTPEQSHENWLIEKREAGWKYGPVKDPEKKEHPCFVSYLELPEEQRVKDEIFCAVVKGVAAHHLKAG